LLAGVVVLGALLRFHDLSLRGIIFWDEAKFALEGMRVHTVLSLLFGAHPLPALGKAIGSAKPSHALLIALGYGLVGSNATGALVADAALSSVNVLLVYLIARRLFDPWVGSIAALFLGISEYDVLYARSGLSEDDATFFLLAAFYLLARDWTGGREKRGTESTATVSLAALALSVGFTTNYRLILYIAAVVATDLLWVWTQSGPRRAIFRALVWLAGLVTVPLLWQGAELLGQAHGVTLFKGDITQRTGYLREVLYQLHEGKQAVYHFAPERYVQWYTIRSGWPQTILVAVGLATALWKRSARMLAVAVPILIPYAVYTFAPFIVPRNMVAALPFTAILAAIGVRTIWESIENVGARAALAGVLVLLVGATMLPAAWQVTGMRSGFAQAADYLEGHGGRALTVSEVMVFYLRGNGPHCHALPLPLSLAGLGAYVRGGYRFAVLDEHHMSVVTHYIRAHAPRVGHYRTYGDADLPDNPISSENSNPPPGDRAGEYLDVYRIDGLRPPGHGGRVHTCSRDKVT
jgi:hypothetical protein